MKRLLVIVILMIALMAGYSQSQRLVLLEEFTSATCGPCVSANNNFHTWQTQNPDKFTSIYYHVNWPSPGDPMNLANPSENGARVSFYGVSYVPQSNLDGNFYNGSATGWNKNSLSSILKTKERNSSSTLRHQLYPARCTSAMLSLTLRKIS